jgi:hypothetical protein
VCAYSRSSIFNDSQPCWSTTTTEKRPSSRGRRGAGPRQIALFTKALGPGHPQLPYLDFALGEARDRERPYGEAKVSLDALAMSRKLTGKNDLYTIAPGSNSASTISSPSPGWPNPAVAVHANTWSPSAARAKPAPRSQERARWRHIDARFHQRRGNVPNGLATLGCLRDPPWTLWRILCISASTSWKLSFERRSLRSSGGTEYL